jgi:enoyl-CoA hydratase
MGGGFELALACDIRIAQDGPFSLGLPEVNIGLLPGAGGTQRLTRLLGAGAAMSFMLLGRTVSPRDAVALGLVHSCVPDARAEGLALAEALAAKSAQAIAHIKRLVHTAGQGTPAERLADERTLFCDLMVSDEAIALMAAMNRGERDIREP